MNAPSQRPRFAALQTLNHRIYFITGTDTGVGKTALTVMLTRRLGQRLGTSRIVALKPLCSGDRGDAIALRDAMAGQVTLDAINPWHFRAALAPRLAAAAEGRAVTGREVVAHIRSWARAREVTLVEGAGGLLSPLAVDADAPDIIAALRAIPVIVCPNRLGAINQALLVLRALPRWQTEAARVVLMQQPKPDHSTRANLDYLRGRLGAGRVFEFPWFSRRILEGRAPAGRALCRRLDALVA